jgi:hypothetical protein
MAWKVYDAMPGSDGREAIYGPLPCKRWIPDVPHKKHKMSARPAGPKPGPLSTDDQKAVQYACWIAARDGIALPNGSVSVYWSGITTRAGKWSKRVFSVTFRSRDGKEGQIINLPNWDFDPVDPVEETISADIVFLDMLPRGLAILAQAA